MCPMLQILSQASYPFQLLLSLITGVNAQLTANIGYLASTKADISNPTFHLNDHILGGLSNFSGTIRFYGLVNAIPMLSITSLSLFNVANTKPTHLPLSTAMLNALSVRTLNASIV